MLAEVVTYQPPSTNFMIDANDISEDDPRIKAVAEILLAAGESGVYSAARAAIAWHENEIEKIDNDPSWDGLGV